MRLNLKILIIVFILGGCSLFGFKTYQKIKVHNTEYNLMQSNWDIDLKGSPIEETLLFKNTDNFHGDGLKVIEFKFNSVDDLNSSFKFQQATRSDLNQFIDSALNDNERENISNIVDTVLTNINEYVYYSVDKNYDSLLVLLDKSTKTLLAFIKYI
ncbi:MAG: hypothetical protein ACRDAU_05935 [Clostridium sp.]